MVKVRSVRKRKGGACGSLVEKTSSSATLWKREIPCREKRGQTSQD